MGTSYKTAKEPTSGSLPPSAGTRSMVLSPSCIIESSGGLLYDRIADLYHPWPSARAYVTMHR